MAYVIGDECIACHNCAMECPTQAIQFVHTKYEVIAEKCVDCGHCEEVCNIGMAYHPDYKNKEVKTHERQVIETDLVVLGGGASGLVAAVRAAETSGKKVVVLEKAAKTGGNAWYAHGFVVHGSKWQLEEGIMDSRPMAVEHYKKQFQGKISDELIEKAVYGTGAFFDWLESIDKEEVRNVFLLAEDRNFAFLQSSCKAPVWKERAFYNLKCRDDAIGPGCGGSYVIRQMRKRCEQLGVKILTQHEAVQLLSDTEGAFRGVLAKNPGGEVEVHAKACILSTGGWTRNDDMIRKYMPSFFGEAGSEPVHRFAIPTATGDVVKLGHSIDANIDEENMWLNMFGPVHHPFSFNFLRMSMEKENVYVNMNGKRFFNEAHFFDGSTYMPKQPKRVVYSILDSEMFEELGKRLSQDEKHTADAWVFKEFRKDLEEELQLDTPVKKGNTLEELAEQIGVPVDTFVETIKTYNEACKTGEDKEFGKEPGAMRAVAKPPYYAFFQKMATDGAFGGVSINDEFQVLNTKKQPIRGLYATGDNSAGWGFKVEGDGDHRMFLLSELTWALTSGFLVGKEVSDFMK